MNTSPKPPLWRQLQAVAQVLAAVRAGRSLTPALDAVEAPLRPGVQALSFLALRGLGRAQALRRQLARRAPPPAADTLLCAALALATSHDGQPPPYEPFTLVDQAVEAAKRSAATRQQASFINACLRRFLREQAELLHAVEPDPEATWNHPSWWIDRLRREHPHGWQAALKADGLHAPMTLRVNRRRTTLAAYRDQLQADGRRASGVAGSNTALVLERPCPVQQLPGWAEGWVSVQDAAAQLAAPLLLDDLVRPHDRPLRVLDACAAPGGKTAHLLEMAEDAEVLALDVDAERCQRVRETLRRLQLRAEVRAADAGKPADWWNGQPFDAILLDAPCTASGIVRRHPDVPWLRRESDVAQLAATQARLLDTLWPLLRPGGRLLYATCSVFRAEGDGQIETFVARNTDVRRMPAPGHLLPQTGMDGDLFPDNVQRDHDGFYYARLEKIPH